MKAVPVKKVVEKPVVKHQEEHKQESKKPTPIPKAHTAPQIHHTNAPVVHKPATPVPHAQPASQAERKPSAVEDKAAHHQPEPIQDGDDVNQIEENQADQEEPIEDDAEGEPEIGSYEDLQWAKYC